MSKVSNWGFEAIKFQQQIDRAQRGEGTLMNPGGDAKQGERLLDSYVPLDRDYSREDRKKQQQELHEMMQSIRAERSLK